MSNGNGLLLRVANGPKKFLQTPLVKLGPPLVVHKAGHSIQLNGAVGPVHEAEVQLVAMAFNLENHCCPLVVLEPQKLRPPLIIAMASHACALNHRGAGMTPIRASSGEVVEVREAVALGELQELLAAMHPMH